MLTADKDLLLAWSELKPLLKQYHLLSPLPLSLPPPTPQLLQEGCRQTYPLLHSLFLFLIHTYINSVTAFCG